MTLTTPPKVQKLQESLQTKAKGSPNLLHSGDRIVLVAGAGLAVTRHNMIVVHELD